MRKKFNIFRFIRAFFPLQLIFGHFKYNLFSLFFWLILFGIAGDSLGAAFGLPYLFYSPEYQGEMGLTSFFLIGFSLGGFTMSFHTYSYIRLSKRYPFILTVSRPFIKFCLNNSVIPLFFLGFFLYKLINFHLNEEFASSGRIASYIAMLLVGYALFISFAFFYFFPRNKHIFRKIGLTPSDQEESEAIHSFLHRQSKWQDYFMYDKHRRYVYMSTPIRWRVSRSVKHYDQENFKRLLRLSRINSSLFEVVTVVSFLALGLFREHPVLDLPAGMSIIMLLAIILMIFSAFQSWFKYWTYPVIILMIISMNQLSKKTSLFQYRSYAFGLSYEKKDLIPYTVENIFSQTTEIVRINQSRRNFQESMLAWKQRTGKRKPKMMIILTSGGGSRSAMWTFATMNYLDSLMQGKLMEHTQMITGASGGMIGAAYYRSLYLNKLLGQKPQINSKKVNNISSDLLNKLSVAAYSSDLFFRFQEFHLGDHHYTKDRGYAFEENLNENTESVLDQKLSYFNTYEKQGMIPSMLFTPTIVNDGRRMIISAQPMTFLCSSGHSPSFLNNMYEYIDFQTMFEKNNDLRFLSVLRMNATFPLVLPMVSLPTKPEMHVMDAGIRDNYGGKMMMNYLFSLKDWIDENTSGVVIVKIRDTKSILKGERIQTVSMLDKLVLPFGNMYKNFTRTQDFDQDELLKIGAHGFDFPIDMVVFNLREKTKDRISLSWHLTSQEKQKINKAIYSKGNQHSVRQLLKLLGEN
ncbi:MAG: hypothetical protein EP338_02575 [Bacteroidetes bacterium]|nr:MAG: hypothetical protein EP338_02575 [Bacteroidota bacterium]